MGDTLPEDTGDRCPAHMGDTDMPGCGKGSPNTLQRHARCGQLSRACHHTRVAADGRSAGARDDGVVLCGACQAPREAMRRATTPRAGKRASVASTIPATTQVTWGIRRTISLSPNTSPEDERAPVRDARHR
jgi:hypothetical protein